MDKDLRTFFLSKKEALDVITIIDSGTWSCFEELESYILERFGDKTSFIMIALKKFMREEKYDDSEIHRFWVEFTRGEPIRLSMLDRFIDEFCERYNICREKFLRWWEGKSRLVEKAELNPEILAGTVNYYVLRYILQQAHEVQMVFPRELEGRIAREAKFRAMLVSADVEFKTNDEFQVIFYVGNRTLEIVAGLAEYATKIVAKGNFGTATIEDIRIYGGYEWEEYDSNIERLIAECLTSLGAKVWREPKAIIMDKIVFIPDFQIEWMGKKAFLEVVGYWRKEYIVDKEIKIRNAIDRGVRLIVVADRRSYGKLKHIRVPIVTYDTPQDIPHIAKNVLEIIHRM